MTLAFFGLSGLDVLGALGTITPKRKQEIVNWIYAQQILPGEGGKNIELCGFRGSCFIGVPYSESEVLHVGFTRAVTSVCLCSYEPSLTLPPHTCMTLPTLR